MNGFVDMHTHILPGVDDGAADLEKALQLLQLARDNGTRTVLLTPHYRSRYMANTPQLLRSKWEQLRHAVQEKWPDMTLYLGQEVFFDGHSPEALAEGRALAINDTGYALLEFAPGDPKERILAGVGAFLRYGYRPVIAHAERYKILRKDEKLLRQVLNQGALLQLNADSVMGDLGKDVQRFCAKALKNQWVAFIASDAHDTQHRPPLLRDCFLQVHKKYGAEYAHRLFFDNAMAVLAGEEV